MSNSPNESREEDKELPELCSVSSQPSDSPPPQVDPLSLMFGNLANIMNNLPQPPFNLPHREEKREEKDNEIKIVRGKGVTESDDDSDASTDEESDDEEDDYDEKLLDAYNKLLKSHFQLCKAFVRLLNKN